MSGRLLHTGQVVVDLVLRVPTLPQRGGDLLAEGTELLVGGGFNVMAAAARSGAEVLYAGAHGTGRFGEQVRAALRAEGIAVARAPSSEADTGVCVALVEPDGERTFVTGTGAEGGLGPGALDGITAGPADLVYVSGYSLLHESNRDTLLDWLPRNGSARTLFDPGPLTPDIPPETLRAVLSTVDIVSCNAEESAPLTDSVREFPECTLLVRDGANGCTIRRGTTATQVPGFPVTAVDTNGAGDAHCGVLSAELLRGTELETAARRANAAAAIAVSRTGPATAPERAEIDRFLAARQG
ncbi:PfkB family carbohydrate kinase [Sciscionella sediminilitoris]|uniref:PfkB family carbohydrate kinase n=1 Tax=Sciscionella sediminilitoris TaxID=1445613 RepID=UPI0004DEDF3E|nr:PfkB family carbohydrate kinase [Sciscionella sp. SE31]